MKLIIDPKIFEQNHDLKIGAILIKGMSNERRVSAVESLLRGACAQRHKEFVDAEIYDNPMIQVWSQAYGNFGINPKKSPPSIAALLKRIKSGKEIPHVSLLVDLYNYFSLKHLLPIGGEDLDWLCGDLRLTYTQGGEPFRPINSIEVEKAKEGEIAYMDDAGITSRYWNYRECERSKFTNKTVNAVLLIEDLSKMHMDEFGEILREIQNTIIKYIGGQIEPYILNEENNSIDLGIQGRKHADDSKIPQQEIAYFMEHKGKNSTENPEEQKPEMAESETPNKKAPKLPTPINPKQQKLVEILNSEKTLAKNQIRNLILQAAKSAFPEAEIPAFSVEYPMNEDHGDYASNLAMHLAKNLQKKPIEIAQKLIENLPKNDLLAKVELAGPGFINFFLSNKFVENQISEIIEKKSKFGHFDVGKGETLIFEYSSPNIAKPLGVHHLMTTILGQTLRNIFDNFGFNCISINHIGDWGTQFGKLIYAYKNWGNREIIEKNPIDELLKLYVKFHEEAEKNPELEDKGRYEFKIFEEGDKENRELWQWIVDVSLKEVQQAYDLLGGIHFDHTMGESFYEDKMAPILEDGKKREIFVEGKEGAYVVNFDDPNIPTAPVQKKDGATLYITRDFATLKYRLETWNPLRIVYVVDVAQSTHFKQIFATADKLGWYHGEGEHVWFGRMNFKDGKMSTRKGNIILLEDVVKEAIKVSTELMESKNPDLKNKEEVAKTIGIGALKYNILSQNRTTDITFDWDKMLSLDSNSAPYLQYAYARAKSILRKIDEIDAANSANQSENTEEVDSKTKNLTHFFSKYPEYLITSAIEYKPNILCNYLYQLAQKFNSFYNSVQVLKISDQQIREKRLDIIKAFAQVMKNGLELLGLDVIEEM
ncbi:MAG: arginine--tRNA ligase [Patescibacteria group bacterium]